MVAPSGASSSIRKGGKFDMKAANPENGIEPSVLVLKARGSKPYAKHEK